MVDKFYRITGAAPVGRQWFHVPQSRAVSGPHSLQSPELAGLVDSHRAQDLGPLFTCPCAESRDSRGGGKNRPCRKEARKKKEKKKKRKKKKKAYRVEITVG